MKTPIVQSGRKASSDDRAPLRLRVAMIGAGSIARAVAAYAQTQLTFEIVAVLSRSPPRDVSHWSSDLLVTSRADLLARHPDLVVECAGHGAVIEHVPSVLAAGVNVILASSGSLADPDFLKRILALPGPARLTLPAGALPGIDGLSAAARGPLAEVRLTSTKPPLAWIGTPAAEVVDLAGLTAPQTIFSGSARQAAQLYPKNANVAATVALAGLGFDRTEVRLVADPNAVGNSHRLDASGEFGRLSVTIDGNPSSSNPRTSYLTALSIVRAIEHDTLPMVL